MAFLILITLALVLCISLYFLLHHRFAQQLRKLPLPPGTMGWPYIGETLQLYSGNPNAFFANKLKRYGDVFKTQLLGCKCVMIASPEAARFVLASQAQLFKPTFPSSKQRLIGPHALFFHEGTYHSRLRRLVLGAFTPEAIRPFTPVIERIALDTLSSWQPNTTINTFVEMKKFSFKVGMMKIFGSLDGFDLEDLNHSYATLEKGYNCLAINVPGTKYYKAMQARRHLSGIIQAVICKRREEGLVHDDFLGTLMGCKSKTTTHTEPLSDEEIVDNVIGIIFASRDTTASVLTWLIKFLKSSTRLLDLVVEEQERIKQRKVGDKKHLTWEDTRTMSLTTKVIQETLRIATVLSFTFRETVEDVEYQGYVIPKGWKVMPLFKNIHHNPKFFPDPLKFDPSRFEVPPKPNTFMPFGNGVHSCPGNELAKLEILVFVHHLVTKFRWEFDESKTGIQYSPFQVPQEGLPITITKIDA